MAALANPAFLYVGSDTYTSVTAWSALAVDAAGRLIRPLTAQALGNERVYVATTGGTTGAAEPTWTFTKGAIQPTDGTVVWQECTGQPAVNGDVTNTLGWTASAKGNTVALGQIIKRDNAVSYQICVIAGTAGAGAEPAFSDTAGVPTTDNGVTWTSLGAVGNFAAFAAPHSRILNADAATWSTVAGSTCYVSSGHAETQSSAMALAGGQGAAATKSQYLCVANNVAPPTAVTTGATVSTTGASAITLSKFAHYDGIYFTAGDGANSASINIATLNATTSELTFNNCPMKLGNTNAASKINMGAGANASFSIFCELKNTDFVFGATGQQVLNEFGNFEVIGGTFAATGTVPTTAFGVLASGLGAFKVRGLDISAVTGTLVGGINNNSIKVDYIFSDCKLGAAVAISSGAIPAGGGCTVRLHNCDSGSKNYRHYETSYLGTSQVETTIVNNSGAKDGTTFHSINATSSANASFYQPFQLLEELCVWNDTTGSALTMTVEIAGAAVLTNKDIWLETEYLGSASFPISSIVSNRKADILAANTNVTTSTASWGGSPANTQKLQNTFTPQMKGWVKGRVFLAKASATEYVDPLPTVA